MADPVFTLSLAKKKTFAGGVMAVYDFTSDDGTYAAGGFEPTPNFDDLGVMKRYPDLVLFQSANGYKYEYNPSTRKILIRVATTAGTNAIEGEHTAAAVVAAARTGVKVVCFWFGW